MTANEFKSALEQYKNAGLREGKSLDDITDELDDIVETAIAKWFQKEPIELPE